MRLEPSSQFGEFLASRKRSALSVESEVRSILDAVQQRGDEALREYANRWDKLDGKSLVVEPAQMDAAYRRAPKAYKAALKVCSSNISAFAKRQMVRASFRELRPGMKVGQIVLPLERIAVYVPGGRYPLPSTLLMGAIPAQVAGVPCIWAASPRPTSVTLSAARHLRIRNLLRVGGAHAIAAFAFGTDTVPKVDKIVGPGNRYVATAKRLLSGEVGIDSVAGPTEVAIVAEEGNPAWIAADMLAQAEHDVEAAAVLITTSSDLASRVAQEVERQMALLPNPDTARESICRSGVAFVTNSVTESLDLVNEFAPEHLCLYDPAWITHVTNAGSIFLGPYSPEAAGDYATGPNHVLPTEGAAKYRGGLSVNDFVKVVTVQALNPEALRSLAPTVTTMARIEGLEAHARSVEARL